MNHTTRSNQGSLTPEQIEFYDLEGYLVLPHLLNQHDLVGVRQAMQQKVDMIADELLADGLVSDTVESEPFESRLACLFANLSDEEFLKYGRSWRDRLPGYYDLMCNPKIVDAVEGLIGPEIFANPVYNVRPKVPKVAAGAVPWHQDKSYWPEANANPVITVWIPLVDADEVNGCLRIIPRTHKNRVIEHHAETYSGTGYTEVALDYVQRKRREVISLPLEAGGAIFFNDRLVHSSTPNNSDHVRWSVDLRYQPTDQDPMPQRGAGFLCRSNEYPERVATIDDWLSERLERMVD